MRVWRRKKITLGSPIFDSRFTDISFLISASPSSDQLLIIVRESETPRVSSIMSLGRSSLLQCKSSVHLVRNLTPFLFHSYSTPGHDEGSTVLSSRRQAQSRWPNLPKWSWPTHHPQRSRTSSARGTFPSVQTLIQMNSCYIDHNLY